VGILDVEVPISKFCYEQGRKFLDSVLVGQMQLHFYTCIGNEKIERAKIIAKNWFKIKLQFEILH